MFVVAMENLHALLLWFAAFCSSVSLLSCRLPGFEGNFGGKAPEIYTSLILIIKADKNKKIPYRGLC